MSSINSLWRQAPKLMSGLVQQAPKLTPLMDTMAASLSTEAGPSVDVPTEKAVQSPEHVAARQRRQGKAQQAHTLRALMDQACFAGQDHEFAVPNHAFDKQKLKTQLTDNVTVIAGAGGTLAKRVRNTLADVHTPLVLVDRVGTGMQALADKTNKHFGLPPGQQSIGIEADLTNPAEIKRVYTTAAQHFGSLDTVINAIGVYNGEPLLTSNDGPQKEFMLYKINMQMPLDLLREAMPYLKNSPRGSFVHASTIAIEDKYRPLEPRYFASKLGGHQYLLAAYNEARKEAVHVQLFKIGPLKGPMTAGRFDQDTLLDPGEVAVKMLESMVVSPHSNQLETTIEPLNAVELH